MKPAPFDYYAPDTLEGALALLGEHGYDAKLLAGGQSLIPMMNFRLAQPGVIVDLNGVSELFYIRPGRDGGVQIGAMTRMRRVEKDAVIAERAPIRPRATTAFPRREGEVLDAAIFARIDSAPRSPRMPSAMAKAPLVLMSAASLSPRRRSSAATGSSVSRARRP